MKDLFGGEAVEPTAPPKKANLTAKVMHDQLLSIHGKIEEKCKNCNHLQIRQFAGKYFKCLIATPHPTCNPKTDWRSGWSACGKFEKNETD